MKRALNLFLAASIAATSVVAVADDFNHRNSRERRRGDWRRGFGDGTDCEHMKQRLREALCYDYERAGRSCRRIHVGYWSDVYGEAISSIFASPATRQLARQAINCGREREESFDRDVDRESEEWHRRNPDPDPQ